MGGESRDQARSPARSELIKYLEIDLNEDFVLHWRKEEIFSHGWMARRQLQLSSLQLRREAQVGIIVCKKIVPAYLFFHAHVTSVSLCPIHMSSKVSRLKIKTGRKDAEEDDEEEEAFTNILKATNLSPHSVRIVRGGTIAKARDSIRIFKESKRKLQRKTNIASVFEKDDASFLPSPTLVNKVRQLSRVSESTDSVSLTKGDADTRSRLKDSKLLSRKDSISIAKQRFSTSHAGRESGMSKNDESNSTSFLPSHALVEKVRKNSRIATGADSFEIAKEERRRK